MDYQYERIPAYRLDNEQLYATIAPLSKNAHRSLIKPVAFRPMLPPTPPSRYVCGPQRGSPAMQPQLPPPVSTPNGYHGNNSMRSMHSSPGSGNSSIHSPPTSQRAYHGSASPQQSQVYSEVGHRALGHNHSHDDGYASQDYHSHTNSTASQGSLQSKVGQGDLQNGQVAVTYVSDFHSHMANSGGNTPTGAKSGPHERPGSYTSASSAHGDGYVHKTPSPSDSGVGEVEALIREKENELVKLRDTMERNEQAILQVYQERKQNWAMEMRELNDEWDKRLKFQQQKAFKTEQGLLMQLFKLQQEKKALKGDYDQVLAGKDELGQSHQSVKDQCDVLKGKLEEVQWELQQKAGEISLLKSQLKEAKEESSSKSSDMLDLKSQLKESHQLRDHRDEELQWLKKESEQTKSELQRAKEMLTQSQKQLEQLRTCAAAPVQPSQSQDALQQEVQRLQVELAAAKGEVASCKALHQQQHEQWLEEKNKVIRYQKHLQLNYTQMHRKNKMLEAEIEQLTLELESRDIQLSDIHTSMEEQESMC